MINDYSENKMIRDGAMEIFNDKLGWKTISNDETLSRSSYKEVILWQNFKAALKRLNTWISEAQIKEAQNILSAYMSSSSLIKINEEKYFLIRDGISVTAKNSRGQTITRKAALIDFNNKDNNEFIVVSEFNVQGDLYHRRADIIGFVNGLPLIFIELKRNDVDVENAYNENYRDYLDTIPLLFHYNAFIILSNGEEAKVGTINSKYEFFNEWKRLTEDDDSKSCDLERMLLGVCSKENFLDLFENFILFDHSNGKTIKILARNHQFLGVNNAVKAYAERNERHGKLGVFWHTQGSGKSYSMLFLSQKIRRKFPGSPTTVILTDREELNKQISETFEACGMLGEAKGSQFMAISGGDLINKLKGNPSYIFTLIQKFNNDSEQPIISDHDILIISDEAHRSQYGIFANNLEKLLPTASRIGFTGTPLFYQDELTARTFGDYVSIYDFQRAVEDGATVPLYYENRAQKLKGIKNPEITEQILEAIDNADIDPEQREKLEKSFEREIHILMAEPRLRAIAKDFVEHYSDLWQSGKAMFVCLNKVTCVRMYNFVQEYWQDKIKSLELQGANEDKINWMKETEMCVVISQEQNEMDTFRKWGLDIIPHREKMVKRELDKEYKDPDNKFRIVFVCAMWLTGFDVKSLSCLYLDKPMKAHTLMQTIARANRVSEGKSNGLIIDYVGIVEALEKALNMYTSNNKNHVRPTVDKEKLIAHICETITRTKNLLGDFDLSALIDAKRLEKLNLIKDAAEIISSDYKTKKEFKNYAGEIGRLIKYLNHDEISTRTRDEADAIISILRAVNNKRKNFDNTDLLVEINRIINENVDVDFSSVQTTKIDISKIDFELLAAQFKKIKHKNLLIKDLDNFLKEQIEAMLALNPNRTDYYMKYMEIIKAYNAKQDKNAIENTFLELLHLAKSISDEEKRYIREGFDNEEELAIYDLLFSENLSNDEIKQIKDIAKELLVKIKECIASMDRCFEKATTRARVEITIGDILWVKLPDSMQEQSQIYQRNIYEYIYKRYREAV